MFIMIVLLTASTFCAGMAGPAGYTITIDQGGRHLATVFSIMNTAGNIGATLLPVAVGAFARWAGWNQALLLLAALYFAAAMCWAILQVEGQIVADDERSRTTG